MKLRTLTAKKRILELTACFLALPLTAMALEQSDTSIAQVDDVVVTATRTDKALTSAPGSVDVIKKEDIEARNIKSLDEALNTVPGVFHDNKGKGLLGTTSSVTMRGMSNDKRVLFLQDGIVPLNDPYAGGVSYQLHSVEDIKQIEVVKGPFSSLYGGNAMGGVVNIITRMPEKRELTLKTGYGSSWERGTALDDLKKIYFSYGDRFKDKFSLLTSYGYKETNGYATAENVQRTNPATSGLSGATNTKTNTGLAAYLIGDTGDNTWWDDQFTLKGGYEVTKTTTANLSFMRNRYEYAYDNPHTYLRDSNGNEVWNYGTVREYSFLQGDGGREQNTYAGSIETEIAGSTKAKFSIGYLDRMSSWYITRGTTTATTREGGPGIVSDTPSSTLNSDLQFSMPMLGSQVLTFGGSYRTGKAHSKEYNLTDWRNEDTKTTLSYESKGKDQTYSIFVQDEIGILDNLTVYLGFRQDWWQTSDGYANDVGKIGYPVSYDDRDADSFSPKAALVYKPFKATTMRVSAGKAFRAPTVYDLYRTWTSSTGVTYAANPDLQPETVVSYDAGVEQGLWQGMTVKATYFDNRLEDMIYRKTVSATRQEGVNAGEAMSRGVELEATQKFDFGLRLFINYTYTDSEILENDASPESVGKRLIQVPKNMGSAGLSYAQGLYSASLTGRYVGKRYGNDTNTDVIEGVYTSYDPYTTVDAKVAYKLTNNVEISMAIDNILDEDYYGYYKGAGRSWFTEMTVRF